MAGYVQFGIQSQRRLTRMYTDTKSSLDFVSNPAVDEDDELKKLHRKLRIQKDRLTTWGLRWSEPKETHLSPPANDDIDESLSRAGLADVVGSIMSTIKDILAEAEPLWQASGSRKTGFSSRAAEKAAQAKVPLVQWDKSRFEDLVKDFTSSIDTLYDISRMRHGEPAKVKSKKNIELVVREEEAFEKARMDTPQVIDPKRLRDLNGHGIVSINDDGSESLKVESGKQILCLEYDNLGQQTFARERPVLVEFSTYDSLYSFTGIGPPMTRFEKLFNALQRDGNGSEKADFGSLELIGYFEEARNSRFALIYELPERVKSGLGTGIARLNFPVPYYARLADVLSHRSLEPPLEVKYRLAYNLAMSVFDLHSRGVVHGSLALSNVTFFEAHETQQREVPKQLTSNEQLLVDMRTQEPTLDWMKTTMEYNKKTGQNTTIPALMMMCTQAKKKQKAWEQRWEEGPEIRTDDWLTSVNLKRPYLTSYDTFPESAAAGETSSLKEPSEITWYRHRLDPRLASRSPFTMESQQLDLYALALLLVEIGLWQSSKEMQHGINIKSVVMDVKQDPASVCKLLAARCGTSYKNAFQACFEAIGGKSRLSASKSGRADVDLQKVYGRVLSCLEKCCSIEEDEDTEDTASTPDNLPDESHLRVFESSHIEGNASKAWDKPVFRSQVPMRPTSNPTRDSFVGIKEEQKPKKNIPYWESPVDRDSQAFSAPVEDASPQPRIKGRWLPRSRRLDDAPTENPSKEGPVTKQGASAPSYEAFDLKRPVHPSAMSNTDVACTTEDDKDTTWSELDYDDSVFSGDERKSNPTTMSRRTSMSRRTKASRLQALPAEEDFTQTEATEIVSDNIPARQTRVRFEEPSAWPWKLHSPESSASKEEARVVTVAPAFLRSILCKQTGSCLLLDVRSPASYAHSRIRGALNVCVPASQLAQRSFDLGKLAATFENAEERVQLLRWQEYEYIFAYDTDHKEEDGVTLGTITKFIDAGWTGKAGILQGGFKLFAQVRDNLVDWSSPNSMDARDNSKDVEGISSDKPATTSIDEIDCEIERVRKQLKELHAFADENAPNHNEEQRVNAELNSLRIQRRMAAVSLSKNERQETDEHEVSSSPIAKDNVPDNNASQAAAEENAQSVAAKGSIDMDDKDEPAAGPKEKARRFPAMQIMQEHLDTWHKCLMPQINEALRSFYRKHPESVEISLETIGESPQQAKPTILVICTSVGKVKSVLKRRFSYDAKTYGLMVCKGKIVRSGARKRRPKRSMFSGGEEYMAPKNAQHQQRPLNGASIGAFCEDQALAAVSFGGMIMIDGKPYGMSVHHMFDVPSEDEEEFDDESFISTIRSSENESYLVQSPPVFVPDAPERGYELNFSDSEDYDSYTDSQYSSEGESDAERENEPGDIDGIAPEHCQEGYLITQPAFDDVGNDYFRTAGFMNEYLETYTLGKLHASSGLRRRVCRDNLTHEIDWALFKFNEDRMPMGNHVPGASTYCSADTEYPTSCVPFRDLGGLEVHSIGRTTGLSGGFIKQGLSSVKIKGRQWPSHTWEIEGGLGVPGDSGAWVMENKEGRACGHVLAWSDFKRVAYFSPMEIMLEDIKETLDAESVGFPEVTVGNATAVEDEYITVDNSLAELTSGLNMRSVDRNDRPYVGKPQTRRPLTPRAVQGQRKSSLSDLDIVPGMEGMCLSGGRILHSSAV